jgi:hypothetical protein
MRVAQTLPGGHHAQEGPSICCSKLGPSGFARRRKTREGRRTCGTRRPRHPIAVIVMGFSVTKTCRERDSNPHECDPQGF